MIIDNFHIKGVTVFKTKTYSPLVVNVDTPETLEIATQRLKPVAWGCSQVFQCASVIQHLKFPFRDSGKCFEFSRTFAFKQGLRVFTVERFNHGEIIERRALNVKGKSDS